MRSLLRQQSQFVHFFLMTIIILIAVFMRVYNIEGAPPGLYPDEANNATNAYEALATGEFKWFYSDNNGREGMYINLQAISMAIFGVNTLAIKIPSILFGLFSVLGLYFLARELFPSKPRIALIAPYLCAISFWAINFSRIGFRAIAMVPVICFTFYFFFRGIRTDKIYNYVIAGLICGLGFHTYIAFRIMPVLLIIVVILFLLIDKRFLRRYAKGLSAFVVSTAIAIAPLALTFNAHPEYLDARTNDISIFSQENSQGNFVKTITQTIGLSFAKYNIVGDPNFRHGFPPYPMLEPLTGIAFLGGLILIGVLFAKTLKLRIKRNVRNRNLVISGLLLAWFIGFLVPEFLTNEGLPHALRSIGTMPVVFLLAAYGINAFIEKKENHQTSSGLLYKVARVTHNSVLIIFFFYLGAFGFMKYHVYWTYNEQTARAFNAELKDMALAIQSQQEQTTYIIAGPLERLPIQIYNVAHTKIFYLYPNQIQNTQFEKNATIYITETTLESLQLLKLNPSIQEMKTRHKISLGGGSYTIVTTK